MQSWHAELNELQYNYDFMDSHEKTQFYQHWLTKQC